MPRLPRRQQRHKLARLDASANAAAVSVGEEDTALLENAEAAAAAGEGAAEAGAPQRLGVDGSGYRVHADLLSLLADIEDCIAVAEMEGQDGEDTPALRALAARLATTLHD